MIDLERLSIERCVEPEATVQNEVAQERGNPVKTLGSFEDSNLQ